MSAFRLDYEIDWLQRRLRAATLPGSGFRLRHRCLLEVVAYLRALYARAEALRQERIGHVPPAEFLLGEGEDVTKALADLGAEMRLAADRGTDYTGGPSSAKLSLAAERAERLETRFGALVAAAAIERPLLVFDIGRGREMIASAEGTRIEEAKP